MEPVIHHSAEVSCTPRQAYAYFTENDLLETFFTVKADVEPRVGGKYELDWDPDTTPVQATIGCKITALSEGQLLAFDWKGPPPHAEVMNSADPRTHVVVAFVPNGSASAPNTHVHVVHSGWRSGEAWRAARDYFDRAWRQVLDALVDEVAPARIRRPTSTNRRQPQR